MKDTRRDGRMAGLRALVTGSSSGIGAAIATRFTREGAAVVCAGRDLARLEAVRSRIAHEGGSAWAISADLSTEPEIRRLVHEATTVLGGLDVVVNNAGLDSDDWAEVHHWSLADYERIMRVNSTAPFLVSKYAIPHLLEAGGGSLLHMSSICAQTVWPGDFAYGMSKAALNLLSDHIAVEYASRGIRSNTIMPGAIRTALFEEVVRTHPDGPQFERDIIARHPIGRYGEVEEVADLAVLLCSSEAQFMTGANIAIDGGYGSL
jgi:NAD(P)-dependent dehydrogenase (short-subunit alcohol dehydrogenase family)